MSIPLSLCESTLELEASIAFESNESLALAHSELRALLLLPPPLYMYLLSSSYSMLEAIVQ